MLIQESQLEHLTARWDDWLGLACDSIGPTRVQKNAHILEEISFYCYYGDHKMKSIQRNAELRHRGARFIDPA